MSDENAWVTSPPSGGPAAPPAGGQYPPPPSQPQPPYGYPYPPAPYGQQQAKTNGMAIASMVLGIVWVYWIGSILALIFGYMAKRQIDASNGTETGRGMAVAGIVLGWVGVGFFILTVAIIAIGMSGATGTYY